MQNTPGIQWYSAGQLPFFSFPWHWCVSCSAATWWSPARGQWYYWEAPGGNVWHVLPEMTLSRFVCEIVVVVEVGSGRMEEDHWGRSRGGVSYGTADALRHFRQSDGFLLISQRLQSSTEKAATWRRNHFNFKHLSYSAEHTHTKTHTHTNKYAWSQSPKADFSDNQSGEWRTFGTYTAALVLADCCIDQLSAHTPKANVFRSVFWANLHKASSSLAES